MNYIASIKPFVTAYSQSDAFGKLIMLGLIALSLLCWLLLINKIKTVRAVRKIAKEFEGFCEQHKEKLLSLNAQALGRSVHLSPFFAIFSSTRQKALDLLNKNRFFLEQHENKKGSVYLTQTDFELIESHVMIAVSQEAKKLEKNVFILSTIATLAPFLGLLGTVWGILITFSELHSGASAAHNSAILGGLSMALATTVMGLLIAIPALISYNYLKNDLKNFHSDMEDFMGKLLSTLELQYRNVEIP